MSGQTLSPKQIGIGMRISVHPHSNDFERIILDALKETHRILQLDEPDTGIEIATGEVSTYVGVKSGDAAPQLAAYAATLPFSELPPKGSRTRNQSITGLFQGLRQLRPSKHLKGSFEEQKDFLSHRTRHTPGKERGDSKDRVFGNVWVP